MKLRLHKHRPAMNSWRLTVMWDFRDVLLLRIWPLMAYSHVCGIKSLLICVILFTKKTDLTFLRLSLYPVNNS